MAFSQYMAMNFKEALCFEMRLALVESSCTHQAFGPERIIDMGVTHVFSSSWCVYKASVAKKNTHMRYVSRLKFEEQQVSRSQTICSYLLRF